MTHISGETTVGPGSILDMLSGQGSVLRYKKGQPLFSQGDPADAVLFLKAGKIKIIIASDQGKEAVIATQDPGVFVGERCLIGQQQRFASAVAIFFFKQKTAYEI